MFYVFYAETNEKFEEVKELTKNHIRIKIKDNMKVVVENDCKLQIICDWFDLTISNKTKDITFASEDYNMKFTLSFWFEVYYSESSLSTKEMMKLIGNILENTLGDCILLSNADKLIMQRKNGKIKVDDSKLGLAQKFPFEFLGLTYVYKELLTV